jgi:type II secretory pathway pseudopilin PulG
MIRTPVIQHAPPRAAVRLRRGGTLVQLVVVCAIICLLGAILLPAAAKVRAASKKAACVSNLGGIAAAFHLYAGENGRQLPAPAFTQIPWERSLQAFASPDVFACPGDQELAPATLSSYDWRDTGIEETTLAGKSLATARGDAVLAFDALPGWHGAGEMNVATVDGSVRAANADDCVADLRRPVQQP